jgi:hypothetical protein
VRFSVPPECRSTQSAFLKDVFEAAFQVHAALAQKLLCQTGFNGTRSAMKSFAQRSGQSLLSTPASIVVPDFQLAEIALEANTLGYLKTRDDAPLDLLA